MFATFLATGAARGDDAAWSAHVRELRAAFSRHGGDEVRATEDGLLARFASAADAARCAVVLQRDQTGLRVGLAAGEHDDPHGTPVLVATRLAAAAEPGQVLATDVVRQVAGPGVDQPIVPAGTLHLAGVGERVVVAQVCWQDAPQDAPSPRRTISVVICDDEQLLRAGFRVILDSEPDLTVVGEAADGRAAVDVVARRRPDVVLMDVRMPEMDGLEAARRILADADAATSVVMLTTFDREAYVFEALRIGASGFLLKDTPADRLLDAVRVAASGEALLAPSITRRLIERFARSGAAPGARPPGLDELTAREHEVLRLVAAGLTNAEIADRLVVANNTVKTHVARVLAKLGLRDRVQAVVLAYESGLVIPGEGGDARSDAPTGAW